MCCSTTVVLLLISDVRETFTQLFGAYFYYSDEKVRRVTG
jgi:hypothetical protein